MELKGRINEALLSKFAKSDGSVNVSAASKEIGVSRQAIMGWLSGKATEIKDKNLRTLEMVTGYSREWITIEKGGKFDRVITVADTGHGSESVYLSPAPPDTRRIPVINYIQAGEPKPVIDDHAPGNGIDDIWVDPELAESLGPYAFALTVKGDSMTPKFQPGDRIIVDPDIAPRPGEFVVAKMGREEETTLKKYRARGTDENGSEIFELVPLNNDYATILVNENNPGQIAGTVMEHRSRTRR